MDTNHKKIVSSIFQKHTSLSNSSLSKLLEACKITSVEKGDKLSAIGEIDSHEYFLLDSIACRYVYDDQGEMVVSGFYLSEAVITPNFARTVNGRSIYHLEILSAGSLALMPVKIMDSLRHSYEDIKTFGAKVVEYELSKTLRTEVSYRALTAKDRLISFRKEYPNLENIIPHTYIASYLGITPVSFSRLRNELTKQ